MNPNPTTTGNIAQESNKGAVITNPTPQVPVYVTPQPQPVTMGQPNVVYVQAPQPVGQPPIYAQTPAISMGIQPGGPGMTNQPPQPAYVNPNALTTEAMQKQSGEGEYNTNGGMQEAPPVYQDINPSAPPAYQM